MTADATLSWGPSAWIQFANPWHDEIGRFAPKGTGRKVGPSIPGVGDVDEYLAANPRRPGEALFVWHGRLVDGLTPEAKHALLFEIRETYEPVDYIADGMRRWREMNGLPEPQVNIAEIPANRDKSFVVARVFEEIPDQADDPRVQEAFTEFKRQTEEMWDFMTRPESEGGLGITVEFWTDENPENFGTGPYPDATAQAEDLRVNRRIKLESGLGGEHEATMTRDEYDRFRAVHDVFGHAGIGSGFDRHGEYQAYLAHASMYYGDGHRAMASEYHGVNSAAWSGEQGSPGTGKSVLLPEVLIENPWDENGVLRPLPDPDELRQYLPDDSLVASLTSDSLGVAEEVLEGIRYLAHRTGMQHPFAQEYDDLAMHPHPHLTATATYGWGGEFANPWHDEIGRFAPKGSGRRSDGTTQVSERAQRVLDDPSDRIVLADIGIEPAPPELAKVAEATRDDDALWESAEPRQVSWQDTFIGTEADVGKKHVAKVVTGAEPLREGYPPRLYELDDGRYLIADGHHRLVMHSLMESEEFDVIVLPFPGQGQLAPGYLAPGDDEMAAFRGNPWHDIIGRFAPKGTGRRFDKGAAADAYDAALDARTGNADALDEAHVLFLTDHGTRERAVTMRQVVEQYFDYGSSDVNKQLRRNGIADVKDNKHRDALMDAVVLDEAMQRAGFTFDKDTVMLRGVRNYEADQLTEGSTFTDDGFVSVTGNQREADLAISRGPSVYGGSEGTIVELHIPAGTRGLAGTDTAQQEIMLPRGGSYTVTRVEERGGRRIAVVEASFPDTPPTPAAEVPTIDDMLERVASQRSERDRLNRERGLAAAAGGGDAFAERMVWDMPEITGTPTVEAATYSWGAPGEFANPWHDEQGRFAPKGVGTKSDGIPAEAEKAQPERNRTSGADTTALANEVINGGEITIDPVDADDVISQFADVKDKYVDLTAVTLDGNPNMFSEMRGRGVPRDQMPQITPDVQPQWWEALSSQNIGVMKDDIDPSALSATQSELNGSKVGGMIRSMQNGSMDLQGDRLMVSNDGHVLDGHHRWAAAAALSADCGGCIKIPVFVIDLPIAKLLPLANDWVDEQGIARAGKDAPSKPRQAAAMSPRFFTMDPVRFATQIPFDPAKQVQPGDYERAATDIEDGVTAEDLADGPKGDSSILNEQAATPAPPAPATGEARAHGPRIVGMSRWDDQDLVAALVPKGEPTEFANPWHDEIGRFAPKGTGTKSGGTAEQVTVSYDADGNIIVSEEAKALAKPIAEEARRREPELTKRLTELVGDRNPEDYDSPPPPQLFGYDFVFKQEAKIAEKIERVVVEKGVNREQAAAMINDAVRYTIHFDQGEFGPQAQNLLDQLRAENANVKVKNTWPPDSPTAYKGVNVNVTTNDGFTYEIQLHTPESQRVKDQLHTLYERQRVLEPSNPLWQDLEDQMWEISRGTTPPTGAVDVYRIRSKWRLL
jgi:hypothetical protein